MVTSPFGSFGIAYHINKQLILDLREDPSAAKSSIILLLLFCTFIVKKSKTPHSHASKHINRLQKSP